MRSLRKLAFLVLCISAYSMGAQADPPNQTTNLAISPEQENAVLKFVEQHHPQLSPSLEALKQLDSKQYARAIRDIHRTSERLSKIKATERYQIELDLWKLNSRAQLLAANIVHTRDTRQLKELKKTLQAHYDLQIQSLKLEVERQQARILKMEDNLNSMVSNRDQAIEKRLSSLTRLLNTPKRKPNSSKTPAESSQPNAK